MNPVSSGYARHLSSKGPHVTITARTRRGLAGLLGAGAALATILVLALAEPERPSVLEAVQNRFVDNFAASLKDLAIALFGTNDKIALELGTLVICLALGAALGAGFGRRVGVLGGAYVAFAALGIWSAANDALTSTALATVSVAVAAPVGVAVTAMLSFRWDQLATADAARTLAVTEVAEVAEATAGADAPAAGFGRRRILVEGPLLALGLAAVLAVGRGARSSLTAAASAVTGRLPGATSTVDVPTDQPFDAEGLSSFLTDNDDFYRIDTALRVPVVDPDTWTLRITGMVDRELELTFDELLARDLVDVPVTIACVSNPVGGDLIGTAAWRGIPLAELLDEAGVQDGATQLMGESVDGFTAGFPIEAATDGRDTLLAVGMNGELLPREHGYPARLIVPGLYGYVSATKWISEIRVTTFEAEEGYWVPRGWARDGPVKVQSRVDVPASGASVAAGSQPVAGVAWAPTRGIEAVEVRIDEGPWQEAALGRVASADTWVQWRYDWDAPPGEHRIEVRATTADGEVQTGVPADPAPDGAAGHHAVNCRVEA
ncbi:sulfite oxidase [soil metagenome]